MEFFSFDHFQKVWSFWELRGIILFSLGLQSFLILASPFRKKTANLFLVCLLWLSYLLADWAATFAAGIISQGQQNHNAATKNMRINDDLMAFWAPILIIHLGGPDTITALALEDNELWKRHFLQLISQFAATIYVFYKSFPTDLLAPTLLMLFAGLIKYGERVYSLYLASVDKFRESLLTEPDPGPNYAKLMEEYTMRIDARLPAEIEHIEEPEIEFVFASDVPSERLRSELELVQDAYKWFTKFKGLVADLIYSKDDWRETRGFFSKRNGEQAFKIVEIELNFIYEVLYTKMAVIHSYVGYAFRFVCTVFVVVSYCLWNSRKDKASFRSVDVKITYTLLGGAITLDVIASFMLVFSDWTFAHIKIKGGEMEEDESRSRNNTSDVVGDESQRRTTAGENNKAAAAQESSSKKWRRKINRFLAISDRRHWSDYSEKDKTALSKLVSSFICFWRPWATEEDEKTIPFLAVIRRIFFRRWSENIQQFNLIDYSVNVRNEILDKMYELLGVKDVLDGTYVSERWFSNSLRDSIFSELKAKSDAMKEIKKAVEICQARGEWALRYNLNIVIDPNFDLKRWITKVEFDESLILWHIATEILYCRDLDNNEDRETADVERRDREISKTVSDYMLYLLTREPKIMTAVAGIGQFRFRDTCSEAKMFLKSPYLSPHLNRESKEKLIHSACSKLMEVSTDINIPPKEAKGDRSKSVLFEGCRLAKELDEKLGDKKWIVIHKVWIEMLGYAATNCSGNTHAAQLSKGGQLITCVWLLMVHLGLGKQFLINEGNVRAKLVIGR